MDFKGKLAFMVLLVVALIASLSMSVQADGPQPCKYIKTKEMVNGTAECEKCCTSEGLVMGTTFNACRCITHFSN